MNKSLPTIVFLDSYSNGKVDISALASLGKLILYDNTAPDEVIPRCIDADVIITNKVKIMRKEMEALPNLKLICIAATGMNNIDLITATEKSISVKNVANYSTDSVAELTMTLALGLIHHIHYYHHFVETGDYSRSGLFTHHGRPFFEMKGKKWGIIGMGHIGHRVAEMASVFGAEVSYYSTSGKNLQAEYTHKNLDKLMAESDVISIHAPLNEQTYSLIDYGKISLMKPTAFIINVGRGGIVNEQGLNRALRENLIAGAGLDVFEEEPLPLGNPLLSPDIQDKLLLTPHIAWASIEARQRLVDIMVQHITIHFKL